MHISIVDRLEHISAADWNALGTEGNPFLRHEFLAALEHTGCVSPKTGWQPQHLVAHADGPLRGRLLGAAPMYLKNHSYGEYVFDWAWANAYAHAGENYYPKLVAGVPFTPAAGPRLLVAPAADAGTIKTHLIQAALQHMQDTGASSLHWLFVTEADARLLEASSHLLRTGFQFHWSNPGYRDFDDFLSGFTAEKRKKIKRERRHVREAGIEMETLTGASISPAHWDRFHEFYLSTIHAHGAYAYLTRDFFHRLGQALPEDAVLVLARKGNEYVAGALNLRGTDTLYGRYWGCRGEFHSLHFETCYYSAIEYAIARGLRRFEAGAQGGHKLARGFTPVVTRSAHRLVHPKFNRAIADYLARERLDVNACVNELNERAPFKAKATADEREQPMKLKPQMNAD
ncbi:MAG TPA: GNAT family N-acetyltransferase [Sulfuricaulis sp.]|nr:GNAT family N-acetyltransferase [Sulfuricaulis sp.]